MSQRDVWEREYRNPLLVTKWPEPQNDVRRFLKFLKKEQAVDTAHLHVLDLGSGTGRNANYFARQGNVVSGIEISKTAINLASTRAQEMDVVVTYHRGSIGERYPFASESFDLVLDVVSSNSLNEDERAVYISEAERVLKHKGYLFVKALCKDGDKNARALLKTNPGPEYDTYIIKEMGLRERVFSEKDFIELYSGYFKILKLIKKSSYTKFKEQRYKRNFWIAYMQKT